MASRYAAVVFAGVDRLPDGRRCGYWLPEAAYPWQALVSAGWTVVSVSTVAAPPRPGGVDRTDRTQRTFLDDPAAQRALAGTRRVECYEPADFGAVVFTGGAGAAVDLPADCALARFTHAVLTGGGVVAATGYGVAALLAVAALDPPALRTRELTCPSPEEERALGVAAPDGRWLADDLARHGALVRHGPPFRPHVVAGPVITGQNPASAPVLARHLISATARLS
ncbi:DJ-1/PfpI family protein [Krasilnikovia sp. MM14-A1259]|uniref:DJ-1/PfpI family protein n=1 Tax=Krasilnikovia sp. MM14-A1259 TaxID=3373539 RepID=UPI003804A1E6